MHGFIGEFFGTMILIVLGCGACASVNLNKVMVAGVTGGTLVSPGD